MYEQLAYILKTDYEDIWEYVEDNIHKYNQRQWSLLFEKLLESIYKYLMDQDDNFTWELVYEDVIIFLKKHTKFSRQFIDDISYRLNNYPTEIYALTYESNYYPAVLFKALSMAVNCNCSMTEIKDIYNVFISLIIKDEEV